jgi:hypothetical protein
MPSKSRNWIAVVAILIATTAVLLFTLHYDNDSNSTRDTNRGSNVIKSEDPPGQRGIAGLDKKSTDVAAPLRDERYSALTRGAFFNMNGVIAPNLIREMNISQEEELLFKKAVAEFRKNVAIIAKERLVTDAVNASYKEGVYAYRIEPFAAECEVAWSNFTDVVAGILGAGKSKRMLENFPKESYFGNFGSRDIRILFQPSNNNTSMHEIITKVSEYDPHTGRLILERSGGMKTISEFLPDVFQVVMSEDEK